MRFKIEKANILLAVGATVACLLVLEIATRVVVHLDNQGLLDVALDQGVEIPVDQPVELGHIIRRSNNPRVVYDLKPNLSVSYAGASLTTDASGFRSVEAEPATAPSSRTIVGIGDSFMFGFGVDAEASYLAVLSDLLAARQPELGYRIVNTAVPGYNTVMEVETLKEKGLGLDPSLVIIEFVENDLTLPNFVRAHKPVWTLQRSYLSDLVRRRLGHFRDKSLWRRLQLAGLQGVPQGEADGAGSAIDPSQVPEEHRELVGWKAYSNAVSELKHLADQHGFRVVSLFLAPGDSQLKIRAKALSNELGFAVLDVGPVYRDFIATHDHPNYLASPLALSPTDGHPSVLGHRIAAETLFEFLLAEGLLVTEDR